MLLNRATGELRFADGLRLFAGMSVRELGAQERDALVFMDARDVGTAALAPICELDGDRLCAVTLHPVGLSAAKRRAALFDAFELSDPCPDSQLSVRVNCPFGELTFLTDPYFGGTSARLEYRLPCDS